MGNYRGYRRNRTVTDVEAQPTGEVDGITYFTSVIRARKYLIKASCLTEAERREPGVAAKIADAKRVVEKADRRNARRRARRRKIKTQDCPSIDNQITERCEEDKPLTDLSWQCLDLLKTRKELCEEDRVKRHRLTRYSPADDSDENQAVAHYEETFGPEGEVIRFKLHYSKDGTFLKRTRTRQEPQIGDVVLDLTSGISAWRITSNRRRRHPVTPSMRESYENSFLYKVRKLTAGKYASSKSENLKKFLSDIAGKTTSAKSKRKNRKSKLKKRKNRKK